MTKKARTVTRNHKGHHQNGTAQSADMVLAAGAKGTGKAISTVNFWPWSPKSVDAAEDILFAAAELAGFEIVWDDPES